MCEHLMSREKWAQVDHLRNQEPPSAQVVAGKKARRTRRPDGEEAEAAAERKTAEQGSEETSQRQCSCKGRIRLLRFEEQSL